LLLTDGPGDFTFASPANDKAALGRLCRF